MGRDPHNSEDEEDSVMVRLGAVPAEMILVPDYGQVGAGTVVPFTPQGFREVPRPSNARDGDHLICFTVSGSSMIHDGLVDGSRLVCKANVEARDVAQGALAIVELPDKSYTVKHFFWLRGGLVKLVSANPDFKDSYFEDESVRVVAVVLSSIFEYVPTKPIEPELWTPDWEYQEPPEPDVPDYEPDYL